MDNELKQVVVSTFAMPYEIDQLIIMFNQLHRAYKYVDKDIEWVLDVTMTISDTLIDWGESEIPLEYFKEKLEILSNNMEFGVKNIRTSTSIRGAFDQRRYVYESYPEANYHVWLDPDIIFEDKSLYIMQEGMKNIIDKYPLSFITPEIVKYWDYTWDPLVNKNFQDKEYGYQEKGDAFLDSGIKGDIKFTPIVSKLPAHPRYKFGGGLMTVLSKKLLDVVGMPKENLKPYGYEDTYIMWAMEIYARYKSKNMYQFKVDNLVVCENFTHQDNSYYTNKLKTHNLKEQYLKHNGAVLDQILLKIQPGVTVEELKSITHT